MATLTKLPSGKWRAQVRKGGMYRGETFTLKRDAQAWAKQVEIQAEHIVASAYQPVPESYSVGDLIDAYALECNMGGRIKQATDAMLKRELGTIPLKRINSIHLRDFIDIRMKAGADSVTIAADLSFFGTILKCGKHFRRMDLPTDLARDARTDLTARKASIRSSERDREPTTAELEKLYAFWPGEAGLRGADIVPPCLRPCPTGRGA